MKAIGGNVLSVADRQLASSRQQISQQVNPDDPQFIEKLCSQFRWIRGHTEKPVNKSLSLFDLEALVATRMELLSQIDQMLNAQTISGTEEVIKKFAKKFDNEGLTLWQNAFGRETTMKEDSDGFTPDDEVISHIVCRYAFCVSEKWRTWFLKMEEILLRARLRSFFERGASLLMKILHRANDLPCIPVHPEHELLKSYIEWQRTTVRGKDEFYWVPLQHVLRLVKERRVICANGHAMVHYREAEEVFVYDYKTKLQRALHEALHRRDMFFAGEDERNQVMVMADALLSHLVSDPADKLIESAAGSLTYSEVEATAKLHFPLCMRVIDRYLRVRGHLKHFGRLQYGLFLKAIGLSMDDCMKLFSNLMTLKGGGSLEAFVKSPYGYNVRHNYGAEGKRVSYNSLSCVKIVTGPPCVGEHECHGCPFRTLDEAKLRNAISEERTSPFDSTTIKLSPPDIEGIVEDAKGGHFTRACYKYFMATHKDAIRDSLFRSPFECYMFSRELAQKKMEDAEKQMKRVMKTEPAAGTAKRTRMSVKSEPRDEQQAPDAKRMKTESSSPQKSLNEESGIN